ncbi:MAG: hypothetical protein WAP52_03330 [Candidatus Sungiibacteriota bacterium]
MKDLNAQYALKYIHRGVKLTGTPPRKLEELQAFDSADGIKPDGGIFFVQSKKDSFNHIIGVLEVKHQESTNEIRLWRCEECGNGGELEAWDYETLVAKGEPVCPSCDHDMVLISD